MGEQLLPLPHPLPSVFPIVVLSAGLVAATLLAFSRLCAQGLLVAVKESLLLSERKTLLL